MRCCQSEGVIIPAVYMVRPGHGGSGVPGRLCLLDTLCLAALLTALAAQNDLCGRAEALEKYFASACVHGAFADVSGRYACAETRNGNGMLRCRCLSSICQRRGWDAGSFVQRQSPAPAMQFVCPPAHPLALMECVVRIPAPSAVCFLRGAGARSDLRLGGADKFFDHAPLIGAPEIAEADGIGCAAVKPQEMEPLDLRVGESGAD